MTTKNKKSGKLSINYKFGIIAGLLIFIAVAPALSSAALTSGISHPSLLFDDISEVPGYQYRTESPWSGWESSILYSANSYLSRDFSDPDWDSYNKISNRAGFARDLGFAYQITKDDKYADKAREALLNIGLGDQSPIERAIAVRDYGLAYDWIQPYLNETDDRIIRNNYAALADTVYSELNGNGMTKEYVNYFDYSGQAYPNEAVAGLVLADFTNPDNIPLQSTPEDWIKAGTDYLFINDELHSYNRPLIDFGFNEETGKCYNGAYKSYVIDDLLWWFQIYSYYYDTNIFDVYPVSEKIVTSEIWETLPNGYMNNAVTSGNTLETYQREILNLFDDNEKAVVLNYLEKTEGNDILPYSDERRRMPYIYSYIEYENYDHIVSAPPSRTDQLNQNANYQVFRENWEEDSDWLSLVTFNVNTLSNRDSAHHDQLSIEYYSEGDLLLADAGEDKKVLDAYYGKYAFQHNAIAIEDPRSPFPVSDWADSQSRSPYKGNVDGITAPVDIKHIVEAPWMDILDAKESFDKVVGDTSFYSYSLSSPVDFQRTVIHNDNDYFVILDRLNGIDEWGYRNVFRPASLSIIPTEDLNGDGKYSEFETGHVNGNLEIGGTAYDWLSLPYKSETDTGIKTNSVTWDTTNPYGNDVHLNIFSVPASEVLLSKQVGRIAGYTYESEVFSPTLYLKEEPANNLYRITALLSDYGYEEQKAAEAVEVNGSGNALKVVTSGGFDYYYSGDSESSFGKFKTDADILYIRQNEDSSDFRSTLIRGSFLDADGQHLVELSGIDLAMIDRDGNKITVITDSSTAGTISLYKIERYADVVTMDGVIYDGWQFSGDYTHLTIDADSGKHEYSILLSEELLSVNEGPEADFYADATEGELPFEVNFTDASTNDPAAWSWDFGDGEVSGEANPVHTYNESGLYTVTLEVSSDDGTDVMEKTGYINVLELSAVTEPSEEEALYADFSADVTSGTAPLEVRFTDESTGTPDSWTYYFGDGNTSYDQNPVHTYTEPGTYLVMLRVMRNQASEFDFEKKSGYITVSDGPVYIPVPPVADFTSDITEAESGTEVHFTDASTNDPTSWSWNFGDGEVSGEESPVHAYNETGLYTVTLEVSNADGTDAMEKTDYITIVSPPVVTEPSEEEALYADFSADVTSGTAPLEVRFTDESTGTPDSWTYYFGDGNTSYDQNPVHTYTEPGTYLVMLRVMRNQASEFDFEKKSGYITVSDGPVYIPVPPVADFTSDITEAESGTEVHFTDASTNDPTSWSWNFGDGEVSGEESPVHAYNETGLYTVTLEVSNADGTDAMEKTDYITIVSPPVVTEPSEEEALYADFSADVTSGTAPLEVRFTDESTGTPDSWTYYFGDGNTSYDQNPVHTYTEPGTYLVMLRVMRNQASEFDFEKKSGYITVSDGPVYIPVPPVADFTSDITEAESGTEVHFTDASTNDPTSWSWNFGDGEVSGEESPVHAYNETGLYTVTLEVSNADGTDSMEKTDYITIVSPPVVTEPSEEEALYADFSADVTSGTAPLEVRFTDESTGTPDSWTYYFGDGNTSYDQNPVHTYTEPGTYLVMLRVMRNQASEFDFEKKSGYITVSDGPVYIPVPPVADFTSDITEAESGTEVHFTDASTNDPTSWSWNFGDGEVSGEESPVHAYNETGLYTVTLEVSNADGTDAMEKTDYITIVSPPVVTEPSEEEALYADFSADVTYGTAPLEVHFTDESTGTPESWTYHFGDGGTSYEPNPVHIYTEAGTYSVMLRVMRNDASEVDFEEKSGYITVIEEPVQSLLPPAADFTSDVTEAESGTEVHFTDASTNDPATWSWDFGDGKVSEEESPVHTYSETGLYTVTLEVSNADGTDIMEKTDYITIVTPAVTEPPEEAVLDADFRADVTYGSDPLEVHFTDLSTGTPETWVYSFGDGRSAYEPNPVHTYANPGVYTVIQKVTKANGLERDYEKKIEYITVSDKPVYIPKPPAADFTSDVTGAESGTEIHFTDASTNDPTSWLWSFGDGEISEVESPVHSYSEAGLYTVTLEVSNADGTDVMEKSDYITVVTPVVTVPPEEAALDADFTSDVTAGAAPLEVRFTDDSTGTPDSWTYHFGDGDTSYEQNPVHIYTEAGTYSVMLRVMKEGTSEADFEEKSGYITVIEEPVQSLLPPAADFTSDVTDAESGTEVHFTDASTNEPTSWMWDFGDGEVSGEANPVHTYSEAGLYTVTLEVSNEDGTDMTAKTDYITITAPTVVAEPPEDEVLDADFSADVTSGTAPLTVHFTDESTGTPDVWVYSFGDGLTAYEPNPVHTYSKPGTYTVVHLVSKNNGIERDSEKKVEYIVVK